MTSYNNYNDILNQIDKIRNNDYEDIEEAEQSSYKESYDKGILDINVKLDDEIKYLKTKKNKRNVI